MNNTDDLTPIVGVRASNALRNDAGVFTVGDLRAWVGERNPAHVLLKVPGFGRKSLDAVLHVLIRAEGETVTSDRILIAQQAVDSALQEYVRARKKAERATKAAARLREEWLRLKGLAEAIPVSEDHPKAWPMQDRDLEIFRRRMAGETVTSIAAAFDMSRSAVSARLRKIKWIQERGVDTP